MLEVGQPGELPLMRELTALKRTRCLRDPSTVSSWKSPVVGASSWIGDSNVSLEGLEDDEVCGWDDPRTKHFVGGVQRGDGGRGAFKRGSFRSPQLNDVDPRLSWDLGRDTSFGLDDTAMDVRRREKLRNHLERLGVFGEPRGRFLQSGGKATVHERRFEESVADSEVDGSIDFDPFEKREKDAPDVVIRRHSPSDVFRRDRSRSDSRDQVAFDNHAEPDLSIPVKEVVGRKSFARTSRAVNGDRYKSGYSSQVLSPLILSSHDDNRKFSQSQSLFSLEEPYNDEERYLEEQFLNEMATVRKESSASKAVSRLQSPLLPNDARRPCKNQIGDKNTKTSPVVTSCADNATQRIQNSRPGPWEKGLDYQVDELELWRKDSGELHQRSRNHMLGKNLSTMHDRTLASDFVRACRNEDSTVPEFQPELQNGSASTSFHGRRSSTPPRGREIEPLPLLTELEDNSGSEEFADSSMDGDCGRLSTSDLHGELELESCHAPERHHEKHEERLTEAAKAEGLQLAVQESRELTIYEDRPRNLSQKYRPKVFEEIVGQNIVSQALSNAVLKGKIAPVYLFQGTRGTGKTSVARIFAAALICVSPEDRRPCGQCRECISVASGKCSEVKEVDAASNNGIERVKVLLSETLSAPPLSRYKVFIIDECHVLTTETWNALLRILEEPPMNVVFILITTDPDGLPRTAVSRCQKFPFPKIKDAVIVKRLQHLAALENLDLHPETLHLIASRSDGSLRDAETTLDQISLLGENVNPLTVYELVGSASDERMLSLLDSALLADTVSTVRRARELVDSGVEPLSLMTRLATLITDVLAGSCKFTEKQRRGFFRKQSLSEEKLERLRMAMKVLSEAEKQLRVSNDRTTWLTAALLQLGPDRSYMFPASCAGTSVTQSPVALDDGGDNEVADFEHRSEGRQLWDEDVLPSKPGNTSNADNSQSLHLKSPTQGVDWCSHEDDEKAAVKPKVDSVSRPFMLCESPKGTTEAPDETQICTALPTDLLGTSEGVSKNQLSLERLDDIWCRVVEGCRPLPLRQMLYEHGKLVSISLTEVDAVVHLEFSQPEHKARCERYRKSISNVFEAVLGFPVEIKIGLASLPPEELSNSRVQTSGQNRARKGSVKRNNIISEKESSIPAEDDSVERNSACYWSNQGGKTKRNAVHQPNVVKSFPAIPQPSFGPASKQNQHFEMADSNWNSDSVACGDIMDEHSVMADSNFQSGVQCQSAWVHEGRKFSTACESLTDAIELKGETLHDGVGRNQQATTLQDMTESVNGYRQNNLSSDDTTEIDELDVHSPRPQKVDGECLQRRCRMEGCFDSQSCSIDGRRSCDADLHRRKGHSKKTVHRRMKMSRRIRSLPSSDQNSPEDRGSSLIVPRFATKNQKNQQKSKERRLSVDTASVEDHLIDSSADFIEGSQNAAAAQKRSKLKVAAGSFARLFKGSLSGK